MITPLEKFGNYYTKREDKAGWVSLDYPSGSKVRQYTAMAQPGIPMIVGCASSSAMQVYVAAAAHQAKVPGIIYTAKCKTYTDATRYALEMGAEINEVKPGYMSVVRKRAKTRSLELGKTVRWDVKAAVADAAAAAFNIPRDCQRIIIPTGSGLTAAGILVGLVRLSIKIPVVAVAVSTLAEENKIKELAKKHLGTIGRINEPELPKLTLIRHPMKYSKPLVRRLPDGTPLDPFYAAKALEFVQNGDLFWIPGLRPVRSMPEECRREFADWKGF